MLSSFEFVPEQTVAANVARLARGRMTEALQTLAGHPDEDAPAAAAVHDARRGLKRLRALLRLARAGLGEETFRRENVAARDAARELSTVRDAQVLAAAFEALHPALAGHVAPGTPAAVDRWLRGRVDAAVGTLRAENRLPRAVALLTAARERLDTWPWQGAEDGWSVPGAGLKKTYRAARRALRHAARDGAEGEFHEWRKQVKHLGAQVESLRPLCPEAADKTSQRLGKLADDLGDEHDLAVLADTLAEFRDDALPPADLAAVATAIAERRAALRKKALRRGRRLFDDRPGEFARRWRKRWREWRAASKD